MLFNPVLLHLANLISSDALFISLSLIWFNILIWSIYYPTPKLILAHALVLFIAFTVRYNALFYPAVAAIAFIFYRNRFVLKIGGLILCSLLIYGFINFNQKKYIELCGKSQFTPFSGWQIANNAMYAYKYVKKEDIKPVPKKYQQLDNMIRNYYDTTKDHKKHPEEELVASTVYMWAPTAPLRRYMALQYKGDSTVPDLKKWAFVAPFFKDYGILIIKKYPWHFFENYILPNAIKYYAPPVEFLERYNTGYDRVNPVARSWFSYKSDLVTTIFKDSEVHVLDYYPILVGFMNVTFFLGLIGFLISGGYKKMKNLSKTILLVASLWLLNFGFSVFASPIALRFQLFPILVMTSFAFLFMEFLIKESVNESHKGDKNSDVYLTIQLLN